MAERIFASVSVSLLQPALCHRLSCPWMAVTARAPRHTVRTTVRCHALGATVSLMVRGPATLRGRRRRLPAPERPSLRPPPFFLRQALLPAPPARSVAAGLAPAAAATARVWSAPAPSGRERSVRSTSFTPKNSSPCHPTWRSASRLAGQSVRRGDRDTSGMAAGVRVRGGGPSRCSRSSRRA